MQTLPRKEIKYVIPVEWFKRMEHKLDACMERDKNGVNGCYPVRSQYYDSLTDQDLQDNLAGVMEKRKIRLRIYSLEAQQVRLEYKCKSGTDGTKRSMWISRKEAMDMEEGRYDFLLHKGEELALRLYYRMTGGAYHPKTIVEYDRLAFSYPVSDTRITFDFHLRGSANPYGLFLQDPGYLPLLQEDVGVLEIKYNDFLPGHLKEIVEHTDSLAEASSKYSKSRMMYL